MARNFNEKNIIVGAATVYVGKSGVENDRINVDVATDTAQDPTKVVPGGPSSSWYHLGYTMEGVTLNIEPTFNDVMVDQLLDTARLFKTQQRVTVATSLTEATLENMYVAIGGAVGSTGDYQTASATAPYNLIADADGTTTSPSAIASFSVSASTGGNVQNVLHLNGGALGATPVERSVAFVGSAPESVARSVSTTAKSERVYILYRAVSVEAVGVGVRRDDATVFPVNFRVMPSSTYDAPDGNAAYGKILDRIY